VKESGLMLFVFTIGLQLGPGFAAALRHQDVKLNLLAATIVFLSAIGAPLIGALAGFDMAAVLGIYSGAVTNTPSLGAGSQTLSTLPNIAPDRLELASEIDFKIPHCVNTMDECIALIPETAPPGWPHR
jgi:putative transport protein